MSTTEMTTAEIIEQHAHDEGAAVYYSKSTNLVLVRQPKLEALNHLQQVTVVQPSLKYSFAPEGTLVVREGQDLQPDGPGGEMQDVVAWLDSHVNLNTSFHREGHEADRALPIERDFLTGVNHALVARDVAGLKRMLAEEEGSHRRPMLIDTAISALQALRDVGEDSDAPAGELDDVDRAELVKMALELGLEIQVDTTDAQIRAALLVATKPAGDEA